MSVSTIYVIVFTHINIVVLERVIEFKIKVNYKFVFLYYNLKEIITYKYKTISNFIIIYQ